MFSVYDEARGIEDDVILQKALDENWVLITNDRHFGERVYREQRRHAGVVLLRLTDERSSNKIETLRKLLESHSQQLAGRFVVVTETQVRFASTQ